MLCVLGTGPNVSVVDFAGTILDKAAIFVQYGGIGAGVLALVLAFFVSIWGGRESYKLAKMLIIVGFLMVVTGVVGAHFSTTPMSKAASLLEGEYHYVFEGKKGLEDVRYGGWCSITFVGGSLRIVGERTWMSTRDTYGYVIGDDVDTRIHWNTTWCFVDSDSVLRFTYQDIDAVITQGYCELSVRKVDSTLNLYGRVFTSTTFGTCDFVPATTEKPTPKLLTQRQSLPLPDVP